MTSSLGKSSPALMYRQHQLPRTAMGNFRTLLQEITVDAAMLYWLDGAGSYRRRRRTRTARTHGALRAWARDEVHRGGRRTVPGVVGMVGGRRQRDEVRFNSRWPPPDGSVPRPRRRHRGRGGGRRVRPPVVCPFVAAAVHRHLVGTPPTTHVGANSVRCSPAPGSRIRPLSGRSPLRHPSLPGATLQ
ncbi:MAG: DUF1800 family protein [Ilumatobacteraceae bacterium]